MKLPEKPVKFLNNGELLRWYEKAVSRENFSLSWELVEEMARRVYPRCEMMPNIKIVVQDFRHWKCNGAQEQTW